MKKVATNEGWVEVPDDFEFRDDKFSESIRKSMGRPKIIFPSPNGYHPYRGILKFLNMSGAAPCQEANLKALQNKRWEG